MASWRPLRSCPARPVPWFSPRGRCQAQVLLRERGPRIPACRRPPIPPQLQAPPAVAEVASAYSLQVRGKISNVLGREALGDGLHDAIGAGGSSARGIVIQLLDEVAGLLAAQCRKFGRLVALAGRAVA